MNASWTVEITVLLDGHHKSYDEDAARVLRVFADHDGQPTARRRGEQVVFEISVNAQSTDDAIGRARDLWEKAMTDGPTSLVNSEIVSLAAHREDQQPMRSQELLGVAELATELGVSKPRAREVASRSDFPQPVALLAATTVWDAERVREFVARWGASRRPGRPSRKIHG